MQRQSRNPRWISAIVDGGACESEKSVEDLNIPVVKGPVGDKTVNLLRDTDFKGVVVSRRLVEDSQLMVTCCVIGRINNTVLLAEKVRIHVKTPYLSGDVEVSCIPETICCRLVDYIVTVGFHVKNVSIPHIPQPYERRAFTVIRAVTM